MQQAENLIKEGLHPSDILTGYEHAATECLRVLEGLVAYEVPSLKSLEEVTKVMKAVVSSKHYGNENTLAPLVAQACIHALPRDVKNFNVDNIRVAKILGGSLSDSVVVHGLALIRASETTVHHVKDAKVAVYSCDL